MLQVRYHAPRSRIGRVHGEQVSAPLVRSEVAHRGAQAVPRDRHRRIPRPTWLEAGGSGSPPQKTVLQPRGA